jgi:hypothetical protein
MTLLALQATTAATCPMPGLPKPVIAAALDLIAKAPAGGPAKPAQD